MTGVLISVNKDRHTYRCEVCGAEFKTFWELGNHLYGKHRMEIDAEIAEWGRSSEGVSKGEVSHEGAKEEAKEESHEETYEESYEGAVEIKWGRTKRYVEFPNPEAALDYILGILMKQMNIATKEECLIKFVRDMKAAGVISGKLPKTAFDVLKVMEKAGMLKIRIPK